MGGRNVTPDLLTFHTESTQNSCKMVLWGTITILRENFRKIFDKCMLDRGYRLTFSCRNFMSVCPLQGHATSLYSVQKHPLFAAILRPFPRHWPKNSNFPTDVNLTLPFKVTSLEFHQVHCRNRIRLSRLPSLCILQTKWKE